MEGCRSLARFDWKNLQHLEIGYNRVGARGCKELAKQKWTQLQELDIGTALTRQEEMSSECRAVSIWRRQTGTNSSSYQYVTEG